MEKLNLKPVLSAGMPPVSVKKLHQSPVLIVEKHHAFVENHRPSLVLSVENIHVSVLVEGKRLKLN